MGNDKLIGTLAVFKSVLIEDDFISSYIPFVTKVLLNVADPQTGTFDLTKVLEGFTEEYGFTIDRAPMITILNKCAKKELIRKGKNGLFSICRDACEQMAISNRRVLEKEQQYAIVISELKKFYHTKYNIDIETEDVEKHLLIFLNDNSAKTLIVSFTYNEADLYSEKQHQYIISSFINECYHSDRATFSLIADLATAYLMSSAIAYGEQDEKSWNDSFKNLTLYFDTPLLLRVLGLNDESMQLSILAMMEQLTLLGCKFRVFSHTLDEIEYILNDCLRWIDSPAYDEFHASYALRNFVEKHYTKADIQEYIDTLPLKLKHYKITIDEEDYYAGKFFHSDVDERYIENSIVETYKLANPGFDETRKESTISYDTRSIANILKLQKGKALRTYRQAGFVMLTTNSTLSYVTRQFPSSVNPGHDHKIYPCITDTYLGTNIWLAAPINKIEDFSQKKLIADCMSLIQPSDSLMHTLQMYIEKALRDETITEEQYYLIKAKAFSGNYIMQTTLGDEAMFSDRITEEILEEIEKNIQAPLVQTISNLTQNVEQLQADNARFMQQEEAEKERKIAEETRRQNEMREIENNADTIIHNLLIVLLGGFVLPLLGAAISYLGLFNIPRRIIIALIIISVILAVFSAAVNWNLFETKTKIRKWLIDLERIKRFKRSL